MDEEEWYLCHNSRREGGFCLLALFPIPKSINPQVRSRENFKQWFTGLSTAFPDLQFSLEDILAEGDGVGVGVEALKVTTQVPFSICV